MLEDEHTGMLKEIEPVKCCRAFRNYPQKLNPLKIFLDALYM